MFHLYDGNHWLGMHLLWWLFGKRFASVIHVAAYHDFFGAPMIAGYSRV